VTGTDTGVGKTLVACALLQACVARGLKAVGMKPVAAGSARTVEGCRNADVEALRAAGNIDAPLDVVNPYCFAPPIAPHIAAELKGIRIEAGPIERGYCSLAERADVVVVEGVGGFLVPLSGGFDTAVLASRLALPILLVVGIRLGCLNHALLTAEAIGVRGLPLCGWVANYIEADMPHAERNVEALIQRLPGPCIGRIPHGIRDARAAAAALDLGAIIACA
jgi:dethiobiotin synthetase